MVLVSVYVLYSMVHLLNVESNRIIIYNGILLFPDAEEDGIYCADQLDFKGFGGKVFWTVTRGRIIFGIITGLGKAPFGDESTT